MKKGSVSKKLRFKKVFVANLSENDQNNVLGGLGGVTSNEVDTQCNPNQTWCTYEYTCICPPKEMGGSAS